ncbi:hypothetical protein ATCC90586_003472 [Pythium insidiosum]|nr:hypothetical protein ATCC90586_003472 [Pythium insidiosum]
MRRPSSRPARDAASRVGEILSDSNSELSSLEDDGEQLQARATAASDDEDGGSEREDGDDRAPAARENSSSGSSNNHARRREARKRSSSQQEPPPASRPTMMRRKNSKWYDSDGDDAAVPATRATLAPTPTPTEAGGKETAAPSTAAAPGAGKRSSLQRLVEKTKTFSPFASKRKQLDAGVLSPASSGPDTPRGNDRSAITRATSAPPPLTSAPAMTPPVASNNAAPVWSPQSDASSIQQDAISTSDRRLSRLRSPMQDAFSPASVLSDQSDPAAAVSPQTLASVASGGPRRRESAQPDANSQFRKRSHLVQSPPSGNDGIGSADALSPGQRKAPGAFPGRPHSGVLVEGWLRQKQRRGVKGMKKWNSRYFVLYAKTLEVRYYADVVVSAWGPIPLGEIGSISLRLIQRIAKPSHPKYRGCRLDITCRNAWGTHYADDYVSSEDENVNNNNNNSTDRQPKDGTPRSSRVYSLMADSPQTAVAWVNALDSLLVRSANSPRVDNVGNSGAKPKKQSLRDISSTPTTAHVRRRSSALDMESVLVLGPGENVPRAVVLAMNYIFDSTPGIETERFYEQEPTIAELKSAVKYLNQFATDNERRTPSIDEMGSVLTPVIAGGVVKMWLQQLEQPIIPPALAPDFLALARDAPNQPFELRRHLKGLVKALPPRNFAMLACLLFHLNDVNVYASKNGMDAELLARRFSSHILRPLGDVARGNNAIEPDDSEDKEQEDAVLARHIVQQMIAHVDAIIDEKEAELLQP